MEKRILTPEEIAQVRQWIGARGFKYTDLQAEILDHVACAMEDKLTTDPSLPLRTAFDQVHKSFGIFGFATIEEAMVAKIEKQVWKDYLSALRFFTQQQGVLIVFTCVLLIYVVSLYSQHLMVLLLPYWALFATNVFYKLRSYHRNKKLRNFLSYRTRFAHGVFTLPFGYYLAANPFWLDKSTEAITLLWPALLFCGGLCLIELCGLYAFSFGIKRSVSQAERYVAFNQ
jgi:hypothetical protein